MSMRINQDAFLPVHMVDFTLRLANGRQDFERLHVAEKAELGDVAAPPDEIERIWRDYPYGIYILEQQQKDGTQPIYVGTFVILPVDEKISHDFRQGRIGYQDLDQANLKLDQVLEEGWSIWRIALLQIVPSYRKLQYQELIPWLLAHAFNSWADSGVVRYPVQVFTTGFTAEGEAMLKRFGFTEETPGEKMAGGRPCYSITANDKNEVFSPLISRGLERLLPIEG
jgi:hypothetical protein